MDASEFKFKFLPFGFVYDHSGTTSDKNGDGLVDSAVFDLDHSIFSSSEVDFLYKSGSSEFLRLDFAESRDNASSGGKSNELNFGSSYPSN